MLDDCPFCHHTRASVFQYAAQLRFSVGVKNLYQCSECSTIYPRPRFDLEEQREFLRNCETNSEHYLFEQGPLPPRKDYLFPLLLRHKQSVAPVALDIGTFNGRFCRVLENAGYRTYGIEPQYYPAAFAREAGLQVYCGVFPEDIPEEFAKTRFDLISILECIYYFVDLKLALQRLFVLLNGNGVLLIKAHQGTSHYYRAGTSLFSRYGDLVQGIPTEQSLRYCLLESGFGIESAFPWPEDYLWNRWRIRLPSPFGRIQTLLNVLLSRSRLGMERADRIVMIARKTC